MGLLSKRYDMIALLLQAAPKVHHNLPKAIITLNSPEAIIAGDLLCGRLAKEWLCEFFLNRSKKLKNFSANFGIYEKGLRHSDATERKKSGDTFTVSPL